MPVEEQVHVGHARPGRAGDARLADKMAGRHQHFGRREQEVGHCAAHKHPVLRRNAECPLVADRSSRKAHRRVVALRLDLASPDPAHRLRAMVERQDQVADRKRLDRTLATGHGDPCAEREAGRAELGQLDRACLRDIGRRNEGAVLQHLPVGWREDLTPVCQIEGCAAVGDVGPVGQTDGDHIAGPGLDDGGSVDQVPGLTLEQPVIAGVRQMQPVKG